MKEPIRSYTQRNDRKLLLIFTVSRFASLRKYFVCCSSCISMFASAAQRSHESCARREFVDLLLVLLIVLLRVTKAYAVSYDWSRGHEQNHPSFAKGSRETHGENVGNIWQNRILGKLHSSEMTEDTGI